MKNNYFDTRQSLYSRMRITSKTVHDINKVEDNFALGDKPRGICSELDQSIYPERLKSEASREQRVSSGVSSPRHFHAI
jgi:hypothetical protein